VTINDYSGYHSHATSSAKEVLVDVNHLRFLADGMQNLPEKVKPYSGPLVKSIILLSVCRASALNTLTVNIP